jgi:ferritin-like protein
MSDAPNTSAVEELRRDPSSRKRFLRALGGGAAAASLAGALAACGGKKPAGNQIGGAGVGSAQFGQGDAGIVNYALYLEYLESDFYRLAVASGNLRGRALELAKRFGAEERGHVVTLEGTVRSLGGTPAARPKPAFMLSSPSLILTTMNQLEAIGAAAYLGQLDRIQSKQVLAAALSIHSVEARHAAAISTLLGQPISPDGAFARPLTSVDVTAQIRPFVVG